MKLIFKIILILILCATQALAGEFSISKYKVNTYGFINTDAIYDAHGATASEGYVFATTNRPDSDNFNLNVNATRIGIDLSDTYRFNAKAEIDFNGTNQSSEVHPRLRQGYFTVRLGRTQLLFGQTWTLMPDVLTSSIETRAIGFAGALWSRAPQIRLSTRPMENLLISFSAVRPTRNPGSNFGTASGRPAFQGEVQVGIYKATLSMSGALGRWSDSFNRKADVEFFALGLNLPISIVTISGQLWTGKNLDDYFGGCGNVGYDANQVKAKGGFGRIQIQPHRRLWFEAGMGIDDPEDLHLAAGSIGKNEAFFGNASVRFFDAFTTTLEYGENRTEYVVNSIAPPTARTNQRYSLTTRFEF